MVRVQHALVMDRYATWRTVYGSPGPRWQLEPGTQAYNETFFGGKAAQITRWLGDEIPKDAEEDLLAIVTEAGGDDAEALVTKVYEVLPGGQTTGFDTTHDNTVPIYKMFDGPVRHRHTRAGNDWKFTNSFKDVEGQRWEDFRNDPRVPREFPPADAVMGPWQPWVSHGNWWPGGLPVSILMAIREGLFDDLDQALENIQNNDNPLAGQMRELFVREPGYRGATVHWVTDDEEQAAP